MSDVQKIEATAHKIASITAEEHGGATITLVADLPPVQVDAEYLLACKPIAGGYYVCAEGGYKGFLPAEAIENASA